MDEHEHILAEVLAENDEKKPKRTRIWSYLGAGILILLMTLWLIPATSFPERARPNELPTLDELTPPPLTGRPDSQNINAYVRWDDPELKLIASKVVTSTCSTNERGCAAESLYYFVRDNIGYLNDPINEYYETPRETLLAGNADCDGQAILLASLLATVGIQNRFAYEPGHVYVEAWLPKKGLFTPKHTYHWVALDPTCKDCPPGKH